MSVITILKMGDPRLQQIAEAITDFSCQQLTHHIKDMIDTMRHFQGVGLAAPQIGISKQIIVLEVNNNERYPQAETIELDVLINPQILEYSEQKTLGWEGCLSLPGLRGRINRALSITYQAQNPQGHEYTKTVEGFHARIIQHEFDHLQGILYPQRIDDFNYFGFEDSLNEFQ